MTDIQTQLTRLAGDVVEREQLRAKGLRRAAQFDWQQTASATLEVYAAAAQGRTPLFIGLDPVPAPAGTNGQSEQNENRPRRFRAHPCSSNHC